MTKVLAVLLAVALACTITVYATAAPSSMPGQVYDLKLKVKQLRLRMAEATAHLADVECRTQLNEHAIILLSRGEALGDTRYCSIR